MRALRNLRDMRSLRNLRDLRDHRWEISRIRREYAETEEYYGNQQSSD